MIRSPEPDPGVRRNDATLTGFEEWRFETRRGFTARMPMMVPECEH